MLRGEQRIDDAVEAGTKGNGLMSTMYWSFEPAIGFGFAMWDGGVVGLPLLSVQKIASPEPSITWLAPVPPMTDWWKLSLMEYSSASAFRTGTSPFCML